MRTHCLLRIILRVISVGIAVRLFAASSQAGTERVLHQFSTGGESLEAGLVADNAGNLYGTAAEGGTGFCGTYDPGFYIGCGIVFELTPNPSGGWTRTVIYNFQGGSDGQNPLASLVIDAAGNLYGTTSSGGNSQNRYCNSDAASGCGTVFRLVPTGHGHWTESVLYRFSGPDGASPQASLTMDGAGNLYGTTRKGGSTQANGGGCLLGTCGVVFELSPTSNGQWTEKVLFGFGISETGTGPTGAYPEANVVFDSSGDLYGTTYGGGLYGYGTVFRLEPNSAGKWNEEVLHYFDSSAVGYPVAGLILDDQGNVYGTTWGYFGGGMVFELSPPSSSVKSWTETVLYAGGCPKAPLTMDRAGNLYGTSTDCNNYGPGTVFELSPGSGGWKQTVLYSFNTNGNNGYLPVAGVTFDNQGNLYGTTELGGQLGSQANRGGGGTVYKLTPSSGTWTERFISQFAGTDGVGPQSNLIADSSGNLYGTTQTGGRYGAGSVFEETRNADGTWKTTILYSFTGGPDGGLPAAGLTFDAKGNLYGTTSGYFDWGTVFELSPKSDGKWAETVLHSFNWGPNGAYPYGGVTLDSAGNIYGTTSAAGGGDCWDYSGFTGCGTVFELSPTQNGWNFTTLHTFEGPDGATPMAGLVADTAGNLYGTTSQGGPATGSSNPEMGEGGCGTVFELSRQSHGIWTETILHSFAVLSNDGCSSFAGLIFDTAGNLYGTTVNGGTGKGRFTGTVFELSPHSDGSWTEAVLYDFRGDDDGGSPQASLMLDSSGNLYGTAAGAGNVAIGCPDGCGTVFELVRSDYAWIERTLYRFHGSDGDSPVAGVVLDAVGNVFGVTASGGPDENGIFFQITP